MTVPGSDPPGSWEWALCGASVTGAMHQQRGLGCDDAYSYGVTGNFVVAAVADGAGSVSGTSAWGSYVACRSVVRNGMRRQFIHDFETDPTGRAAQMRWLFDCARDAVMAQAHNMNLDAALLSTTLSVAVADPRAAEFGQIGDGVIATETDDGISTLLIEAKDEYANSTWFLQSENAFEHSFRTAHREGVRAFALSTDGMSYKITDVSSGAAYEPFFHGSWQHVRSGASSGDFAAMLRGIEDDQTGDDKTMVLSALCWERDDFYPSTRPVRTTVVTSRAPGTVARSEIPADVPATGSDEPAAAQARRRSWLSGWGSHA